MPAFRWTVAPLSADPLSAATTTGRLSASRRSPRTDAGPTSGILPLTTLHATIFVQFIRTPGVGAKVPAVDKCGRPLCGLQFLGGRPRPRRQQWALRRIRARQGRADDRACQRRLRRCPGQWRQQVCGHERKWTLRRLHVNCTQPGEQRFEPGVRRVPARTRWVWDWVREDELFAATQGHDLGRRNVFTYKWHNFKLENTGNVPLPISSVTLFGPDRASFNLTNYCGASVAVGATCLMRVVFHPLTVGYKTATLRAGADNDVRTRPISGTGHLG